MGEMQIKLDFPILKSKISKVPKWNKAQNWAQSEELFSI